MGRLIRWRVAGALLAGIAIFATAGTGASLGLGGAKGHNLTGRSPAEVGQMAHDYVQAAGWVHGGAVRVRLARPITPAEMPGLGLGCPIAFDTIEEPPLMLVILQGDFAPSMLGAVVGPPPRAEFIAFVYDLWAGAPTLTVTSPHGGTFRTALPDPSLPAEETGAPPICPTALPYPKTLHYGDTAPPVATAQLPGAGTPTPVPESGTAGWDAPVPTDTPLAWRTATPVPPEQQQFFIHTNPGQATIPHGLFGGVTEDAVATYVRSHPMQTISKISVYVEGAPAIQAITRHTWLAVQQRYFADFLRQFGFQDATPADTPVYLVELRGRFRFAGGPAPGRLGIYGTGVEVFNANTGDLLLEGGVDRLDAGSPASGP